MNNPKVGYVVSVIASSLVIGFSVLSSFGVIFGSGFSGSPVLHNTQALVTIAVAVLLCIFAIVNLRTTSKFVRWSTLLIALLELLYYFISLESPN